MLSQERLGIPNFFRYARIATYPNPCMEPLRRLFQKLTSSRVSPERALHPVERRLAKEYIKRRLTTLYPELRTNPEALERAYQELDLEPRGVVRRTEGNLNSFGLRVDDALERPFEQG